MGWCGWRRRRCVQRWVGSSGWSAQHGREEEGSKVQDVFVDWLSKVQDVFVEWWSKVQDVL